ncbi:MAG: MFS transporter [Candidatus Thorarchaeota archaeon]
MRFATKETLTEEEIEQGLNAVIRDGVTSQIKLTLTESVFLVAFALALGASNSVIGILAAIPPLAQLLQLPSIYLVERLRRRRMITVIASAASRSSIFVMALIPLFMPNIEGLILLILSVITHAVFNAMSTTAWNSWMRDLIPEERLGRFFSKRLLVQTFLGVIATLATGFFLEWWITSMIGQEIIGYSFVFFAGFIAGMIGVYIISTIPEPSMRPLETFPSFSELVRAPLKNENYRNLMFFSSTWSLATALVAPFFTVYLLVRLGFPISTVTVLSVVTQLTSIMFYRLWGRLSDRFSNKDVLQVTAPVFIIGIILWIFAGMPILIGFILPLVILIHILLGFGAAGINLASGNMALKLAPKGEATPFLASWSFVNSFAAAVAPFLGGVIADLLAGTQFIISAEIISDGAPIQIPVMIFTGLDFLFIISFLVGLYALHRLSIVRETGEVEESVIIAAVLAEARRGFRNLSTVDGLRNTFAPLFGLLNQLASNNKKNDKKKQDSTSNQES